MPHSIHGNAKYGPVSTTARPVRLLNQDNFDVLKCAAALLLSLWSVSASAQRINYSEGFTLWMHQVPALMALGLAVLFLLKPKRWTYLGRILLAWIGYIAVAMGLVNTSSPAGVLGFLALVLAPWALVAGMTFVYLIYARRPAKQP